MKQIFVSPKGILLESVPEPLIKNKFILVRNAYSCVSIGTEVSGISDLKKSLIKKLIDKPDVLKKLLKNLQNVGLNKTKTMINKKLGQIYDIGYSCAGVVEEVSDSTKNIKAGEFVACCGGSFASHAEKVLVPENLVVKIKDAKNLLYSSSVALGAIALQGIRRANPLIGENFLVVGLGLIGQITIQILRNSGINVYAIEPNKIFAEKAKKNGFRNIFLSFNDLKKSFIDKPIHSHLLDGVIITAASHDSEILSSSFRSCRKKGRVVLVGDVGLNINRDDIYKKEIDFLISSSYGPGRYDDNYEIYGQDYPLAYVRWTLNRNMQIYIDMIDKGLIDFNYLIDEVKNLRDAKESYDLLLKKDRPISLFFKYDNKKNKKQTLFKKQDFKFKKSDKLVCSVIGAGSFASEIIIPSLKKLNRECTIKSICTNSATSSINISKVFDINEYTNNYFDISKDKVINTVFVSTRHNSHYSIASECLLERKNVYVEKPLCINLKELKKLKIIYDSFKQHKPILMTGFNRRFSSHILKIKKILNEINAPVILEYSVNADRISNESWIYKDEGGGRNIGEACHFYDLILYLINDIVEDVTVSSINGHENIHKTDNFFVVLKFRNGSLARLNYSTLTSKHLPKEYITINLLDKNIILDNYKILSIYNNGVPTTLNKTSLPDKGHFASIKNFIESSKNGEQNISFEEQYKSMLLTFEIQELI